jgi:hypothetical protein
MPQWIKRWSSAIFRSDWGLWALRTALASIIFTLTVSTAVWVAGDRLLSHALSGFNTAVTGNTAAITGLQGQITNLQADLQQVGRDATNRFVEALDKSNKIEVQYTGDFEGLKSELALTNEKLSYTNEQLGQLILRVEATVNELSGLTKLIASRELEEAAFRAEVRTGMKAHSEMLTQLLSRSIQ